MALWLQALLDAGIEGRGTAFTQQERALAAEVDDTFPSLLESAQGRAEDQLVAARPRRGLLSRLLAR